MKRLFSNFWLVVSQHLAGVQRFGGAALLSVLLGFSAAFEAESAEPSSGTANRLAAAQARLSKVENDLAALQSALARLGRNGNLAEAEALRKKLENLSSEYATALRDAEELRARIEVLRKAMSATNVPTITSLAELTTRLAAAKAELDRKAKEDANLQAKVNGGKKSDGLGVFKPMADDMRPVGVFLVKNQVVPVKSPYFLGESWGGIRVAVRKKDGEPIGQSLRLGGMLESMARDADPKTQYFHFLVCSDSISAFDAAVKFVRKNNFRYVWDVIEDKAIPMGSGGGDPPEGPEGVPPKQ